MRILHVDTSRATDAAVAGFQAALGTQSIDRISDDVERNALLILSKAAEPVVFVIAHGAPSADHLREKVHQFATLVIHIAVSSNPSLWISRDFDRKVASFGWPAKHGVGMRELGNAIAVQLKATQSTTTPAAVLQATLEYFSSAFDHEALIAAYLLRLSYDDGAVYADKLKSFGLDKTYAEMDASQLRKALASKSMASGL